MASFHSPLRGFQNVYLRRTTGGYYTRARFPVQPKKADHELINGKPSFLLAPVFRLFKVIDGNLDNHHEVLDFPRDGWQSVVSVGREEIEVHFDLLPEYRAVQNSNLEVLLAEYDHDPQSQPNPRNLAKAAHRYAATMEDCQARCLLELMARVLDAHFPHEEVLPLAEDDAAVLK